MTAVPAPMPRVRRPQRSLASRIVRSPFALLAVAWLGGLMIASLTAPWWLRYGPLDQDLTAVLQGPSAAHWLGTDELGRDLLSRIVTAAASTLALACLPAVVGIALTVPIVLRVARSPRLESIAGRASEIVLSLPGTVIILALIAAVGTNMPVVMALLGLLMYGGLYRILIGQAQSLQKQLYVEAAAVDGVRPFVASLRHVLPNMGTTVIVQAVLLFGVGIMMQAGLAFIGFGPQPPEPTWGGMIQAASKFIFQQPWMMVPTGVVLALTLIAANGLADVLAGGSTTPPPLVTLRRSRRRAPSSPVAPTTEALEVRDLRIGVDEGPALVTGVSLSVAPGTVLGLVGESGCGKTVTSHALLGLLSPGLAVRGGSIRLSGTDVATASERELLKVRGHQIAYISQEPTRALDPMFTIGAQLTSAVRRLRRTGRTEARRIALALLEDVGIVDPARVLRSHPHQISGGMAQRVAIALALAGRPRVLVADEPTTALDVTVQAEILDLLRGLVAEHGMAMVLVTHDLGVVADICDQVAVMYAGELVETGAVRDVLTRPEHPYTMALLAAVPHGAGAADRLASIPGQVPAPADWPYGCRFAARCRFAGAECATPLALAPRAEGEGTVRCARQEQVRGRQDAWRETATTGGDR